MMKNLKFHAEPPENNTFWERVAIVTAAAFILFAVFWRT